MDNFIHQPIKTRLQIACESYFSLIESLEKNGYPAEVIKPVDYLATEITQLMCQPELHSGNNIRCYPIWWKIWQGTMPYFYYYGYGLKLANNSIAFVLVNETDVINQFPIARVLRNAGYAVLFICSKFQFFKKLRVERFPFLFINEYFPHNFPTNLENLPDESIKSLLKARWEKIRNWEIQFNSAITDNKVKAVVVGNDLLLECRAAHLLAKTRNLPTFCIQHGTMNRLNPLLRLSIVDRYYLFGQSTFSEMKGLGLNTSKLKICGAVYLEDKGGNANFNAAQYLFQKSGKKKTALILFSGQGHGTTSEHYSLQLAAIVTASEKYRDVGFTVKLHPKERISDYLHFPSNIAILTNSDLRLAQISQLDLIRAANLLITGASTSALEAIYFGKPVFTLDLKNEYGEADFISSGATIHSTTPAQFLNSLESFLEDESTFDKVQNQAKVFSKQAFFQPVGRSPSELIARDILECINTGIFSQHVPLQQNNNIDNITKHENSRNRRTGHHWSQFGK